MALELLLSPDSVPFTVSLGLAAVLGVVEIIGAATGLSFASIGEEPVAGPDAGAGDALSALLGWMNPGRLPLVALLMLLLASFGVGGLALQSLAALAGGSHLPEALAAVPAAANALPFTRWLGTALARVLPRDETYDPAPAELVGARGTISIGPAMVASPGRATVTDAHGNTRNLRVVPADGQPLPTGAAVVITGFDGHSHLAAPPPV